MTIPFERARAIRQTEQFLKELLDPNITPNVPENIRGQAKYLLRHYPSLHDLKMIEKAWESKIFQCPIATEDVLMGKLT